MMKILTTRDRIREIHGAWSKRHTHPSLAERRAKLMELDPETCTAEQMDAVVENDVRPYCQECKRHVEAIIEFCDDDVEYEYDLCETCLALALATIRGKNAPATSSV